MSEPQSDRAPTRQGRRQISREMKKAWIFFNGRICLNAIIVDSC